MKIFLTLILLVLLTLSCVRKPSEVSFPKKADEINKVVADRLVISAINLSEDMSTLSTKNDEIFLFIYDYSDTNTLKAPLVCEKIIFDKDNSKQTVTIPKTGSLILFLSKKIPFVLPSK